MKTFNGFPKEDFRERMIQYWIDSEPCFNGDKEAALANYGGEDFDRLCERCDGSTLLTFTMDCDKTCFESVDDNFVIPVSAINVYA